MKKKINVSVGELVERMIRSGGLLFDNFPTNKPVESIRAHQMIQRSRTGEYRGEVVISHQFETDSIILEISGRIDGILASSEKVVIEEIKTTRRNLESLENDENLLHWGQLKLYAYMYSMQEDLREIDCQLTYYQLDSRRTKEIRRHFSREELFQFYSKIVLGFIKKEETYAERLRVRDISIKELAFPFPSYRKGQREMAVEVYRTIKAQGQLIVQASTGIGKTMAVIFPALKAMVEESVSKIFYLTARTTGRSIAEGAIDQLRSKGLRLKSLTLTAKEKICPYPESVCSSGECEYACGYYDRIDNAVDEIIKKDSLTRELIEFTARKYMVCPFEFSLELSLLVDIIICDYNYVFDPKAYLRRFFLEERGDYLFLIDEAHNLAERSREMFSAQIHKQNFLDTRRPLREDLPIIFKDIGKINSFLIDLRKRCEGVGNYLAENDKPEMLIPFLKKFLSDTEEWLCLNIKTSFRKNLSELYSTVRGFIQVAEQYDGSYATISEKVNKDLRLKLFCIDPSSHMEKLLKKCRAAIFFSATMTPPNYFRKILGCDESAKYLVIPSPFPSHNLSVLVIDNISTLYRHREGTSQKVANFINPALSHKKGNYIVFLPSYEYMNMIHSNFKKENCEMEIILQESGMSEEDRDLFLNRFKQENGKSMVGFAVMGGIFGEGIDLAGESLSGAVIVGVGLPAITPERELIRKYFSGCGRNGFEYAYQFPGINRVLQAAGRVIRSGKDRGIVMLIDKRFSMNSYRSLFPKEWQPVFIHDLKQLEESLEKFWNSSELSG